ncbi:CAP domain-containing protein [uncultured Treponema sp.]|uniref:CAP domain-containing protein n=1 Tax=uncultured Treponema sp. TaxID=162155 RepID=UPI0025E8083D|nr:CAP domain-containing protein [uncultured Treponema sp.]
MKKRFLFALFTIFISAFLFCQSSAPKKTKPANSTSTTRKTNNAPSKKRVQQKTQGNAKSKQNSSNTANSKAKSKNSLWNIKSLDTARNVNYLSDFEKNVILEMNKARTNPKQYADLYIVPRLKNFDGNIYIEKGTGNSQGKRFLTREGAAVVKECIEYMYKQTPRSPLRPSKGLTKAAKEHAESQVLTNEFGHTRTDGTNPFQNMGKYGSFMGWGENISYGMSTARSTVLQLLIDDGVSSRGHRTNLMNKTFSSAGVGFAENKKTGKIECVIDYAQNYVENQ